VLEEPGTPLVVSGQKEVCEMEVLEAWSVEEVLGVLSVM
jgi:hypothetical protein